MRLWSLHPKYLDAKGLVALWREALLAQKVLLGETKGYRHHPQLLRFREAMDPVVAIGAYLHHVHEESKRRGYSFDVCKIGKVEMKTRLDVTSGQLEYETQHLLAKLAVRDPARYATVKALGKVDTHPLFGVVDGEVADWEVVN